MDGDREVVLKQFIKTCSTLSHCPADDRFFFFPEPPLSIPRYSSQQIREGRERAAASSVCSMMSAIASHHKAAFLSQATHHSPSSSSSSGSSPSACAACKYQRRRCVRGCILAPHFPADNPKQFLNAHRLFGVSNILKILKTVDEKKRGDAMASIIYQSNVRAQDPVGGCYRIIHELQQHVEILSAELNYLRSKILFYRTQAESAANIASSEEANYFPTTATVAAGGYANMGGMNQQFYYVYDAQEGQGSYQNGNMANGVGFDMNINAIEGDGLEMGMLNIRQGVDGGGEEDVKPVIDIFDMRHSFEDDGDSKDETAVSTVTAFHYSSRTESKEDQSHLEQMQENDLKGAASLFTLTNCNA